MLVQIPDVLDATQVQDLRMLIDAGPWVDGQATAGHQSAQVKRNLQLDEAGAAARQAGARIVAALSHHPLFFSAALPRQVYPPLFNRYSQGMHFGQHVDGAIRTHAPGGLRLRADLSATLFLEAPESYAGGELEIEDTFGTRQVKLPAGHMVLYPASSVHRVLPVTRGTRTAAFFWIQSMVRADEQRRLLHELDQSIMQLGTAHPGDPALVRLVGTYHNLLRMWAEA